MLPTDRAVIHSSSESDWVTPPALVAALKLLFPQPWWDCAATAANSVGDGWYGPDSPYGDGLAADWTPVTNCPDGVERRWLYWCNPPYARRSKDPTKRVDAWAEKCWERSLAGSTVLGLFPYATQTAWFRRFVMGHGEAHRAVEVWRFPYRLHFLRPDGVTPAEGAGVNHCLILWRPYMDLFIEPWVPTERYFDYKRYDNNADTD